MPGINAGSPLDDIKGLGVLSLKDISAAAGVSPDYAKQLKSGRKGLGPDTARRVASASRGEEKAANIYAVTQAASLKSKIAREAISPQGVAQSLARITENLQGGFHRHEFDRSDPAFKSATEELHTIGTNLLDILGDYNEPDVATKSADEDDSMIQRDHYGRRLPDEGAGVDRDMHGRRMS